VTRTSTFVRSLGFAAAIAFLVLVTAPLPGAVRLLWVASIATHVAVVAPTRRRALAAAALAAALGAALWSLPFGFAATAIGGAAILGVCRSGVLYQARPWRAAAVEGLLLGSGLGLAALLAGSHNLSHGLSFWAFWLVQSGYFLMGGIRPRAEDDAAAGDPFERAHARILALLE
jgi:hypothetical protein